MADQGWRQTRRRPYRAGGGWAPGRMGFAARRQRLELLEARLENWLENVREQLDSLESREAGAEGSRYYGTRGNYETARRGPRAARARQTEAGRRAEERPGDEDEEDEERPEDEDEEDYESWTKSQLIEHARELGVQVRSDMTKDEIIGALRDR